MRSALLFLFIVALLFIPNCSNAQTAIEISKSKQRIDSLKKKLSVSKTDKELVDLYNLLSMEYIDNQSLNDSTLKYVSLATELSEKIKYEKGLAEAKYYLGLNYFYHNKISKATILFIDALKIVEKIVDKPMERRLTFDLGRVYKDQREFEKARAYFDRSLSLALNADDKRAVVKTYDQIAGCYDYEKVKNKAIETSRKNLAYCKAKKDTGLIATAYSQLGSYHRRSGKVHEGIKYYDTAIIILSSKENLDTRAAVYNSYANAYMDLGDLKKATYYFQQSLDVSKQNRDQGREAIILRNLGLVAAETKEYKVAEKYFLQSLELCKEIDFLDMELFNYEDLTELYNLTKNFEKAFQYHKIYTGKKDSLSDVESNRKSVESEMNYEFEKKQVAVEAERAIAERLKEEEANKQKMIRNVFIIGFCFVLVLAVFIFRGYKQKQKANIIISKQKEEVEKQKDVIEEQKLLVEEKNKEVMDSIRYAKRIQTALMSSEKSISNTIARLRKNKA